MTSLRRCLSGSSRRARLFCFVIYTPLKIYIFFGVYNKIFEEKFDFEEMKLFFTLVSCGILACSNLAETGKESLSKRAIVDGNERVIDDDRIDLASLDLQQMFKNPMLLETRKVKNNYNFLVPRDFQVTARLKVT